MKSTSLLQGLCLAFLLSWSGVGVLADEGKDEAKGKERKRWEALDKDDRKYKEERRYKDEPRREADRKHRDDRERGRDRKHYSYFQERGYTNLRIPEGHLPAPGECRVWYPGRPPGHQPPPGRCDRVSHQVPAGAWLIRRPRDDHQHVNVHVYDERSPGIVATIGVFAANTGVFVRYVSP